MNTALRKQFKKIKVLALDVDGVLTDGKIIFDSDGKETKIFDVQDGFGLVLLKKAGFKTAIITARGSKVVEIRAKDLNVDKTYVNAFPKIKAYAELLNNFQVQDDEVCFIGDDWPDLQVLKKVGCAVSVPNARPEVKKVADYITKSPGGAGAIREVVELILRAQGLWEKTFNGYR